MKQIRSKLSIAVLIFVSISIPVLAQVQMADSFGVDNAISSPNTNVIVPVNITNVSNGPIQSTTFDVLYNSSVISLDSIQAGVLTANWENILLGANKKSITLATPVQTKAIANGSTGSIVLLNFSVKNVPGASTWINMSEISFANTANMEGTAPAKNGTFNIISAADVTPPVINNVTLNTTTPNIGQAILVTVNATDNVGVTSVEANSVPLNVQGGNTFTWSGAITATEGTHSVNVSARDAAGNVAWDNSTSYTAITPPAPGTPSITDFSPPTSTVTNNVGENRTFSITVNQTVDITWFINGTPIQSNNSVTSASYTNTSAAVGTWNVTAVASNTNGTDSQIWVWNVTSPPVAGTPVITSWSNNKTNDASLNIMANVSETIQFNGTANQSITTWKWVVNDVDQNNNFDNFNYHFASAGTYKVEVNATNTNGTSNTIMWNINVQAPVVAPTFNISGFKLNGATGNGIQGWLISAENATTGVPIFNTTTDATGFYQIPNLTNGTYSVIEETRAEFTPNGSTSQNITIAGHDVTNVNFTNEPVVVAPPTFNISGFKINNDTGSGIQGWNITVKNATMQKGMLTGSDGSYKFTDLVNGTYTVTEELQAGWMNVSPISQQVTINGADIKNINFTNQPPPGVIPQKFNISGFKLNGATGNGIQGWNITLTNSTMQNSTSTDADGSYKFIDLVNGTYNVSEEQKPGFTPVGATFQLVIIAGKDVESVNFTNTPVTPVKLGSISGTKFNDSDGDGVKDANEPGLANWIITLKNSSTGAAIFNTTTASDGSYRFSNLSAGNYTVGEVLKSNWIQTAPKPVPPGTYMVTITAAGEDATGKDFGNMLLVPPPPTINGSISGFSINTETDKGLPNVTIRLVGIVGMGVDTKQIRAETITDSMGKWMFDNLPAGRYIIIEQLPKGFIPVSPPVMNLMLAKGQNAMNNNFTNRPISSLIK